MVDRPIPDGALIRRAPEALWRRTLDGVLVLAPGMSEVLQLSAPGDAIWELLAAPLRVEELVAALSDGFGVPVGTIRAQIQPTLDALLDGGALLVLAPGPVR